MDVHFMWPLGFETKWLDDYLSDTM